jgi:hypothetical protein
MCGSRHWNIFTFIAVYPVVTIVCNPLYLVLFNLLATQNTWNGNPVETIFSWVLYYEVAMCSMKPPWKVLARDTLFDTFVNQSSNHSALCATVAIIGDSDCRPRLLTFYM